ncbi:MAG: hypothetical protein EB168_06570 [Euryarchaeota archaeon]|nr:hypothetical protein [Euryarchaeota archaeon]
MPGSILSFGDSFIYGTDLADCQRSDQFGEGYSTSTWPALTASRLELDYQCWALGGVGNQHIACMVLQHSSPDSLAMINWTWSDRFDYHVMENHHGTLRPAEDTELERFYYRHLHSEIDDKIRNLQLIYATIAWLREHNIAFIMTIMDRLLLDTKWNTNTAIRRLQESISTHITWFPGQLTFLEWSRANAYPESDAWHPLEEAHAQAADIMLPKVQHEINTHIT